MMAQEDQNQRHNNTSNNSTSSSTWVAKSSSNRKLKQKKVPQRGLGVAQLEKIRLEEQRKKEATVGFSPSITTSSTIPPISSSYLPLPISNFNQNPTHSSALIPFPPPSQTGISSTDSSLFRPGPSTGGADINVYDSGCVQLLSHANGGATSGCRGANTGWALPITAAAEATTVVNQGNVPKFCDSEYGSALQGENPNLRRDHRGLGFQGLNSPYDRCNPSWPLPAAMHRTRQSPQPPPSPPPPPMVTVSAITSPSPVLNFQAEPPSNQSYCGNYDTPVWAEEDKMVGMKRSYPFSLENQAGPFSQSKVSLINHPIRSRSDESSSCGNGGSFMFETINPIREEVPSCSTSISEWTENNNSSIIKGTKENGALAADFLTLAPPALTSSSLNPLPLPLLPCRNDGFSELVSPPDHQGSIGDPNGHPGSARLTHSPPFYSFFPPAKSLNGQTAGNVYSSKDERDEAVDLSLKL